MMQTAKFRIVTFSGGDQIAQDGDCSVRRLGSEMHITMPDAVLAVAPSYAHLRRGGDMPYELRFAEGESFCGTLPEVRTTRYSWRQNGLRHNIRIEYDMLTCPALKVKIFLTLTEQ